MRNIHYFSSTLSFHELVNKWQETYQVVEDSDQVALNYLKKTKNKKQNNCSPIKHKSVMKS